ncbi:YbaN family protein [Natronospora cellulosivora (SeqCode)]
MPDRKEIKTSIPLLFSGSIAFFLGAIGVVVPLLPTTPFILLSAFCFSKGSARAHKWILNNRWSRNIIENWKRNKGISRSVKIKTLFFTFLSFAYSLYMIKIWYLRFFLLLLLIVVSTVVLRMPIIKD